MVTSLAASFLISLSPPPKGIEVRLQKILLEGDVPGLSISKVQEGQVTWSAFLGRRQAMDLSKKASPVNNETVFEAASLGKPIVAIAALWLWERGRLNLDESIEKITPLDKLADDRKRLITPRMLLTHTSGLSFAQPELEGQPGKTYSYSTLGNRYLQAAVEKRLGEPLETWAQRTLFGPLNMQRTSFVYAPRFEQNRATGRNWLDVGQEYITNAAGTGAFDLITTSSDYAKLWAGVLSNRVLGAKTVASMFVPQKAITSTSYDTQIPKKEKVELSAGLGILLQKQGDQWIGFQWGDNGGSTGFLIMNHRQKSATVFLSNAQDGLHAGSDLVASAGMKDLAIAWLGYEAYNTKTRRAWKKVTAELAKSPERGTELFQKLKANDPTTLGSLARNLGYYLKFKGFVSQSETLFRAAIVQNPKDPDLYECVADALLASGNVEQAAQEQERAIAIEPSRTKDLKLPEWVRSGKADISKSMTVSPTILASYAGVYGDLKVEWLGDKLVVTNSVGKVRSLVPVSETSFISSDLVARYIFKDKVLAVTFANGFAKDFPRNKD